MKLEFVVDEGGLVTDGVVPDVTGRLAMIAIAEKGYATYELSVEGAGGHSSMPPVDGTTAGILAAGLARLEANQMPIRTESIQSMLSFTAPEMPFLKKLAVANFWLFGSLVTSMLSSKPSGNAVLRTTTAITMLQGSEKDNILPKVASARVNFRLAPGDSLKSLEAHIRNAVNDDRIQFKPFYGFGAEASPMSPTDGPHFALVHKTIKQIEPSFLVAPFVSVGATDSRMYYGLTPNVYRFVAYSAKQEDLPRFHGINERIHIKDLERSVRFYVQLIQNADDFQ